MSARTAGGAGSAPKGRVAPALRRRPRRVPAVAEKIGDQCYISACQSLGFGMSALEEGPVADDQVVERKLAVIFAADVAEYSRLMGLDEVGTLRTLQAHRAILDGLIAAHHGRIFNTAGDSVMADFASPVDAVECAVAVQETIAKENANRAAGEQMRFRIGVHLGDVIVEGANLFGDGVNIAARLEALAEPGGICLSGAVRDQIGTRLPIGFAPLGEQRVKNIAEPVRAFKVAGESAGRPAAAALRAGGVSARGRVLGAATAAAILIAAGGGGWWLWSSRHARPEGSAVSSSALPFSAPRLSIVVLPFDNLGKDPEQEYFADGITDDLTTDLSRIADMLVISRNTAFTYRDKVVDTKQIGRELRVRYVLEGSVQRSGNQVRVNAQLIDAETGAHLWAERFDRDIGDLFALQSEITSRIANALNLELMRAEAARPTDNPNAMDYIFKGRAALAKGNPRESAAIGLFERALALDPRSVEARSRLALALVLHGQEGGAAPDDGRADFNRAEVLIEQALASSPEYPVADIARADLLANQRRCEDAIPEYEKVLAVYRNAGVAAALGYCKFLTG